ncbi:MAG: MerR family transcriptional regulator [Chloroflexi bacterium]|nr:MerR family transcriptional regulator [Chloroflexota bacterium]NOG66404.1 MerR family transcriptional regulator [Chloroflexota bacterium]
MKLETGVGLLTIGEVAKRVGLQTSAIRYYEELGLIQKPPRISGQRRYPSDVLQEIALIQLAQAGGLTLAQIHNLLHGFGADIPASERWHKMAEARLVEVEAQIQAALRMKQVLSNLLECTCQQFSECVTNND